jgi:hypothetical protein
MKHTIIIDDNTKAGAGLLEIARSMAKLHKSVKVKSVSDEDEWLISEMQKSRKSGEANKDKMLKRFNIG